MTFDLVHVLLPQRPASLHAEPPADAAGLTGNGFGDGAVGAGVVSSRSRLFDGAGRVDGVVVGHVCETVADGMLLASTATDD